MRETGVADLIRLALEEDIGEGDVTSRFFITEQARTSAHVVAREAGVLAGTETAAEVFRAVDAGLEVRILKADGEAVKRGDRVMTITGATRSIVTAERVALNFLQRLSGVATLTRQYVEAAGNSGTRILDTRKTTPGWRVLEKGAVRAGGGANHRMGLYDQVIVKDNHLLAADGSEALQGAIDKVKEACPEMKVELEADTLEQVVRFLKLEGVDVILLDNMSLKELREAVALAAGKVVLEASGGVTLETVGAIAGSGVDCISAGALTHSARAIDLSLELEDES